MIHTDGREIELRTCHRYEYIYQVIDEERSDQHKRSLLEPLETEYEIINGHGCNHRIISEIPHIERFTEPNIRTNSHELHRRLASKQSLLGRCKEVVEIREKAIELKRIRIPIGQERHLYCHSDKSRKTARVFLIQINQCKCQGYNPRTLYQHGNGMIHT